MNGCVVVDASVVVKWLVREERSDEAREIARSWQDDGVRIAAPCYMPVEVTNVLHRRVVGNEMSVEEAVALVSALLASGIELHDSPDVHGRALEMASLLRQGAVYDVHYLALAETLGCELWTADERFYRAATAAARAVRWIGEPAAPG